MDDGLDSSEEFNFNKEGYLKSAVMEMPQETLSTVPPHNTRQFASFVSPEEEHPDYNNDGYYSHDYSHNDDDNDYDNDNDFDVRSLRELTPAELAKIRVLIASEDQTKNELDELRILLSSTAMNDTSHRRRPTQVSHSTPKLTRQSTSEYAALGDEARFLIEDTFSFLVTAPIWSIPFMTSVFIMGVKGFTLILILTSVLNEASFSPSSKNNPLGLPVAVTLDVVAAQFVAIFITVATQDDLESVFISVLEGYSDDIKNVFRQASCWKWVFGLFMRFILALFAIAVTFMLIIRSSEVIELLLNFTAVEFISLLDNVAFRLASTGFFGRANYDEAVMVRTLSFKIDKRKRTYSSVKFLSMLVIFLLLVGGWGAEYYFQVTGRFQPQTIVVQFDDSVLAELGAYSGAYSINIDPSKLERAGIRYTSQRNKGQFGFCEHLASWTFHLGKNPCQQVLALSASTSTFDITETAADDWFVSPDDSPRSFQMDFFLSVGCTRDEDCGGENRGHCSEDSICECEDGYFGLRCDYRETRLCTSIEVSDAMFTASRVYATNYHLLRSGNTGGLVQVYNHPVYVSSAKDGESIDIILYAGLRWLLFHSSVGLKGPRSSSMANLSAFFESDSFDPTRSIGKVEFTSEPVIFNTPQDHREASPAGLEWFVARGESLSEMEITSSSDARLLCSVCDDATNPCLNGNKCLSGGTCDCTNGATGRLCQSTPLSNGHCDLYFNTNLYSYDGGDCCEWTCRRSEENECGVERTPGSLEHVDVGFPNCQDPQADGLCEDEDVCWTQRARPLDIGLTSSSRVRLSSNGLILVVSQPHLNLLQVFDLVDTQWMQRGSLVLGDRDTDFGSLFSISTPPGSVLSRRFGKLPVLLSASFVRDQLAYVQVIRWEQNDYNWDNLGDVLVCSGCKIVTVDASIDRVLKRIVLFVRRDDGLCSTYLRAYLGEWSNGVDVVDCDSASLSGDGSTLVSLNTTKISAYDLRKQNSSTAVPSATEILDEFPETHQYHFVRARATGMTFDGRQVFLAYDTPSRILVRVYQVGLGILFPKLRFSKQAIEEPVSNLQFSSNAESLVLQDSPNNVTRTRIYSTQYGRGDGSSLEYVKAIDLENGTSIDVSDRGPTIAHIQQSKVQLSHIQTCAKGDLEARMSLSLNDRPANISWALQSVVKYGNISLTGRIHRNCSHCYTPEDTFSHSRVSESFCISPDEKDCLLFSFKADEGLSDGSGFAFFINGTEKGRSDGSSDVITITEDDSVLRQKCGRHDIIQCGEGESLLAIAILMDDRPNQFSWRLEDDGGSVIRSRPYLQSERYDLIIEQMCVASDSCYSFVAEDAWDNGLCCSYGQGYYSVYFDGQQVVEPYRRSFLHKRHIFGNGCQEGEGCSSIKVTPGRDANVQAFTGSLSNSSFVNLLDCEIETDGCADGAIPFMFAISLLDSPEDLSWNITDFHSGEELARSRFGTIPSFITITQQTCVKASTCLVFMIRDETAQWRGPGSNYSLSFGGSMAVEHDGNFGAGEMILFGNDCPRLVNITIQTSFTFTDSRGFMLRDEDNHTIYEARAPRVWFDIDNFSLHTMSVPLLPNKVYYLDLQQYYVGNGYNSGGIEYLVNVAAGSTVLATWNGTEYDPEEDVHGDTFMFRTPS